jgi:exodeoxyribonuclease V gamma subunit
VRSQIVRAVGYGRCVAHTGVTALGLRVHRAERSDALVAGLAEVLSAAPDDPFTPDVVAVPSRGVERWIAQSLSAVLGTRSGRSDGVCANVVFPSPARLVREALAAGSGIEVDGDPWAGHRLPWPLLEVIDGCASEDWCRTLGRHLGSLDGAVDQGRRMAVAQKLAGLFTAYGAQRPTMVRDWLGGRDTDGYGNPLDADHLWQAELWRRLRDHIDVESPAERVEDAIARLCDAPELVELPGRLSVFGPTRLTMAEIQVIDALAAQREVHLWLPYPSSGLWEHVADGTAPQVMAQIPTRRHDPTADVPEHPLVRSLGRDAREMQLRLQVHTTVGHDEHLAVEPTTGTLLGALQHDIHADRTPSAGYQLADDDASVQVHACHGRQRQVEVLREVLLGLLADDPTLEPRDIIVMCPDIESYAPLIAASFGLSAADLDGAFDEIRDNAHPGHRLSVRLADRSLRQTNPVLAVAARLLELADSRLTASEVLDLAAMPPVRRRFHLDDDSLERVGDWVRRAGVRWGVDAEARGPFGLAEFRQNTWESGLDRILVGVTMDEDDLRSVDGTIPLDDVDSNEIDLAGRLAELLDRLDAAVDALNRVQTLDGWLAALGDAVESLVAVSPQDAWQVSQARWQLADTLTSAEGHVAGTTLRLSDLRALLGERLKGRPTRANFRTGALTMCTMVPMRSVPHRVVCLLGLDDGVFPRTTRVDGDDILARHPRVGERDARAEDRQLFLDAILAAKERLVCVYSGADERTGAERPPAVPLGELLDVLDRTAQVPIGRVRDRVLTRHPLQPFDARNFVPGVMVRETAFSFDRSAYEGSRALLDDRKARPPFLTAPVPDPDPPQTVELDALVRFLEHPAKGFLRQRLELSTTDDEDEPSDAIPVDLDGLEKWAVGDRLLRAGVAGIPNDRAVRAEWLRGQLPPGRLGNEIVTPIAEQVSELVDLSADLRSIDPTQVDVSVALPSGVILAGTVPSIHGDCIVRVVYSKLSPKHRLRAWVYLLALSAYATDSAWRAATVGRNPDRRGGNVLGSFLGGISPQDALTHLDALVRIYRTGMTFPLPLPPETSCRYAEKRAEGKSVHTAVKFAGYAWRSKGSGPEAFGEFDDAQNRLVWGDSQLQDLFRHAPEPDGTYPEEPHLFGQLARRVWSPLLAAETRRDK